MVAKKKAVKKTAKKIVAEYKVPAKKKTMKSGKPKVRHEKYDATMGTQFKVSDAIRKGRMIHEAAERMLSTPIINMGTVGKDAVTVQIMVDQGTADRLSKLAGPDGSINIPQDFLDSYFNGSANVEKDGYHFTMKAVPSKAEILKADNVMTQAQEVIYGDREKTYGHPSLNLESIAQMWNVYIHRKAVVELSKNPFAHDEDIELVDTIVPQLTVDDVCQMMVMLKMARLLNDPKHHDSMVDQVGYIGLQERVQGS